MGARKASIKETGEELSPQEWERFDAAVAEEKARRSKSGPMFETCPSERDVARRGSTGQPVGDTASHGPASRGPSDRDARS